MDKPSPTSVYLYYDLNGVLLYVGITARGPRRQAEHNSARAWWPYVEQQDVEHFPTRPLAESRERELIRAHQPPFNTQHNPAAEAARDAYMTYRRDLPSGDPVDLARAVGKAIPLRLVEHKGKQTIFSTTLPFASVAQRMERTSSISVMSGPHTLGEVHTVVPQGPVAILTASIRQGVEPSPHPCVHVKIIYGKGGATFRVRYVQLGEPQEATA